MGADCGETQNLKTLSSSPRKPKKKQEFEKKRVRSEGGNWKRPTLNGRVKREN